MAKKQVPIPTIEFPDTEPVIAPGQPFLIVITAQKNYAKSPGNGARVQLLSMVEEALRKMPGWDSEIPNPTIKKEFQSGAFQLLCAGRVMLRHSINANDTPKQIKLRAEKVIGAFIKACEKVGRSWSVVKAVGPDNFIFNLTDCRNARNVQGKTETALIQLPDRWEPFFQQDIYGLEPQIRLMWDSFTSFVQSDYEYRTHICCFGQPGSGKTTVCNRWWHVIRDHSPEGAVLRLTASQTTKAGLENLLLDINPKPSLIYLQELDKTHPDNISALLDLCDVECVMRKTNARDGNKEVPMQTLFMCSINDLPRFKKFHDGALASRFSQKVFFPRPNAEVLRLIAVREIRKMGGDERWAKKAITQLTSEGSNDPRRLRTILSSRKRLLDGTAIADMEAMIKALRAESEELKRADKQRQELHVKLDIGDS